MNEKPTVGSQFFGNFPSDRIPKELKDVDVRLFIHSFPISLMQPFLQIMPENSGNFLKLLHINHSTLKDHNTGYATVPK